MIDQLTINFNIRQIILDACLRLNFMTSAWCSIRIINVHLNQSWRPIIPNRRALIGVFPLTKIGPGSGPLLAVALKASHSVDSLLKNGGQIWSMFAYHWFSAMKCKVACRFKKSHCTVSEENASVDDPRRSNEPRYKLNLKTTRESGYLQVPLKFVSTNAMILSKKRSWLQLSQIVDGDWCGPRIELDCVYDSSCANRQVFCICLHHILTLQHWFLLPSFGINISWSKCD